MSDEAGSFENTAVLPRLWTADMSTSIRVIDDWMVWYVEQCDTQAVTRDLRRETCHTKFCILRCETRTVKAT